jgi:hypothetical protein
LQAIGGLISATSSISAIFGGTGLTSYSIGDIIYGSAGNTLSKLSAVDLGNVLISGGAGAAPSWGKVGLSTHVSGILSVANGGMGQSSFLRVGYHLTVQSSLLLLHQLLLILPLILPLLPL